jgi:glycosyltransferase involved in cell wall biosynthesis
MHTDIRHEAGVARCTADGTPQREPKLAVLMSVHRKVDAHCFRMALDSILNQSWPHFDLYIMLDGPQGPGVMACAEEARDDRVRLVASPQNRGLAQSLNKLIDIAARFGYDFYARMDADDLALPERFEKQLRYFSEHESVDVVGTACIEIDAHGRELGCVRKPLGNSELRAGLPLRNPFIHPTVMFRRSVFEAGYRYPTDGYLVEDYSMWVMLQSAGFTFANLEQPTLWFRRDVGCLHRRRGFRHAWAELRVRARSLRIPGNFRCTHLGWMLATFVSKLLPAPLLGVVYNLHRRVCMNFSQPHKVE